MNVWRIRGKILRTVRRCIAYYSCAQRYAHIREQFLQLTVCLGLCLLFVCFSVCFNQCHCVLVLLAFVVLGLFFSILSQGISWEEHLQNYLFCVQCDIKP